MASSKLAAKHADNPHILTANSLLTGRILYWSLDGWDASPDKAIRATTPDEIAELEARGKAEEMVNMVVGAYLVSLATDKPLEPLALRERRRLGGPSIGLPGAASV